MKIIESIASFFGLKGNIIPIFNLELLSNVGWHMFEVIWQPFVLSLGASVTILGALDGFSKALKSLLQLFMGRISDRVGRKKPIYFSYAFMLTGLILFIAARSWIWLVPAMIMWAFSDSIWEPIFPPHHLGVRGGGQDGHGFQRLVSHLVHPGILRPSPGRLHR